MFSSYYLQANGHVYPNKMYEDDVRVVVISPEDREAVERLRDALIDSAAFGTPFDDVRADSIQAALREFADPKPPRPDEPQGAGATVEDEAGEWWIRVARGADGAVWHRCGYPDKRANWSDIPAVTVHSEGVA